MGTKTPDAFDLLEAAYERGKAEGKWDSKSGFARYVGVSQATASAWLCRHKKPGLANSLDLHTEFGIAPKLWPLAKLSRAA